jgi:hypothetical protein
MATFRVVHVSQSGEAGQEGWAVERTDPDEKPYIVSRLYPTALAAQACADKRAAQEIDKATD